MSSASLFQQVQDRATYYALKELAELMPDAPQAGFRAYRRGALTLGGTSNQLIICDTVEYDLENEYDFVTGLWVPKHTGQYLLDVGVALNTLQGDGAQCQLKVYRNGNRERYFYLNASGASVAPQFNGCGMFNVAAGDYYELRVSVAAASTVILAGTDATWFSAMLQRKTA